MKLFASFRIAATLICLATGPVPQAIGQTLSSACASALHEGAYSGSATLKEAALSRFKSAGCVDEIIKAYGAAGVPQRGDASPLALAAIAYKTLLAARADRLVLLQPPLGGTGGGYSAAFPVPGVAPPGPRLGSGGGIDAFPRVGSGGGIDAFPTKR